MVNLTGGTIASGNTTYNLDVPSEKITKDVLTHPYVDLMRKYGIINDESMRAAQKGIGDTITMPNRFRLTGAGADMSKSLYTQAGTLEYGNRKVTLQEFAKVLQYERDDTIALQRDSLGVLKNMGSQQTEELSQYAQNLCLLSMFNQLGGNTATSISAPTLGHTFTGTELTQVTGLASVTATPANYTSYGSNAGLANPSVINATNALLTMQDLQRARRFSRRAYDNVPRFMCLDKTGCDLVAFVSDTGMDQLINQARATGADFSLSEIRYSLLQGGKQIENVDNVVHVPGLSMHIISVPDDLMPRAVHSGIENALSRTAIVVGKNAIDFAVGAAYPGVQGPSFNIEFDEVTNKLDKWIYGAMKMIYTAERVVLNGSGSNSGNSYNLSTYTILHSADS